MVKVNSIAAVLMFCSIGISACVVSETKDNANNNLNVDETISNLPSRSDWVNYMQVIEKFYVNKDAIGQDDGIFPTWRCNDGSLRNKTTCPGEDLNSLGGMPYVWGTDFVRMHSRQTFAYGAIYNVTGNVEDLKLHLKGVKFIQDHVFRKYGGFNLLFEDNKPVNNSEIFAENPQDLSYMLMGLAMNVYLTGDSKSIDALVKTQRYIFDNYYDENQGMLTWSKRDTYIDKTNQQELVAQLDQLNAYMLLSWRLIPAEYKSAWSADIKKLVDVMNTKFYDKEKNKFNGCLHDQKECFGIGSKHGDFGHRVKTFWMEYLAALGLGDEQLATFARNGMLDTVNKALADNKIQWFEDENLGEPFWWVKAELNQVALTLALDGNDYVVPGTLKELLANELDTTYGELKDKLKTHLWRNGFHSSEQGLMGYILSDAIRYKHCDSQKCKDDNLTKLYFAPTDEKNMTYTPYLYGGDIKSIGKTAAGVEVTFTNVGLPKKVK
jgi:mannose/cellobiose epimerase-like protein (N-acyl-D-glucosamine 2-epimerase family)